MNFKKFCLEYSNQRFINNPLTDQRLDLILKRNNYNRIYTFTSNNKILGYVLAYENTNIIHYWFFYNTSLLDEFHVGKYMMEQIIYHAKENNKSTYTLEPVTVRSHYIKLGISRELNFLMVHDGQMISII